MKRLGSMVLILMLGLNAGCIIVDDDADLWEPHYPGATLGDIWFYWSFEMASGYRTQDCSLADVSRVDVFIYDAWGDLEAAYPNRPCEDTGAILENFRPDSYEIRLQGRCPYGTLTHEGSWLVDVYEGVNDYDDLTLSYLGPC